MKKLLLFSVLIAFAVSLNAQTRGAMKGARKFTRNKVESVTQSPDPTTTSTFIPVKPANILGTTSRDLFKIPIASSYNVYTLLVEECSALTYNEDLNTIMFTHRQCSTYPMWAGGDPLNASAYIQSSFSTDGGMTFDSSLVIYDDLNGAAFNAGRYPSGVFYNPPGNTDPYEAYSVICGPLLADTYPGSGSWDGDFFASMKLDSTNLDVQKVFYDDPDIDMEFARRFLTSCDDGTFHVFADNHEDNGTNYTSYESVLNDGVWDEDENAIEWTRWDDIPEYTEDSQGFPNGTGWAGYAWSDDGQIGYLVYSGNHDDSPYAWAYTPFAYKTENGGEDWDLMDIFDFRDIPTIYDSLFEVGGGTEKHPMIPGPDDICVDANGMLHYLTYVYSSSSIDPDSLGWYWQFTNIEGILYDLYTTPDGGWDALAIDFVYAKDTEADQGPLIYPYGARPQMSKTPDGTKIFYVWADTDPALSDENIFPDIFAKSMDVTGPFWTDTKSITYLTQFWALDNHYMYCSDYTIDNGGSYSVPVSTSRLNETDPGLPAYHSLLHGVDFVEDDYYLGVGIDEKIEFNQISNVSQNYPNPFSGTSVVTVELTESSNLSIEVFNLMGQQVYGYNAGIVGSGVHNLTIDGTNLQSGVFFYTVKADETSVTRKMIVN